MIGSSNPDADPGAFILVFVVAMLTSVFGLTILASANLHIVETVVGLLGRASAGPRPSCGRRWRTCPAGPSGPG